MIFFGNKGWHFVLATALVAGFSGCEGEIDGDGGDRPGNVNDGSGDDFNGDGGSCSGNSVDDGLFDSAFWDFNHEAIGWHDPTQPVDDEGVLPYGSMTRPQLASRLPTPGQQSADCAVVRHKGAGFVGVVDMVDAVGLGSCGCPGTVNVEYLHGFGARCIQDHALHREYAAALEAGIFDPELLFRIEAAEDVFGNAL